MSSRRFSCTPLTEPTEIRLLILQHGVGNDPIQGTLRHTLRQGHDDSYEEEHQALSYEWRNAGDDDPNITVNGRSVRIQKNLHEAIKQIRDTAEDLHLWIDALCINQANLREKSQQVGMMGEIFGCANGVIAWLGVERDGSDVAMGLMKYGRNLRHHPLEASDKETILALCHQSYWRRVWIPQELFLARSYAVRCGTVAVDGNQFDYGLAAVLTLRVSGGYKTAVQEHRMRQSLRTNTLRAWLHGCIQCEFEFSKEHDLIYALLGISSDRERIRIVPDYEKPLRDVYLELLTATKWGLNDKDVLLAVAEKFGLEMDRGLQYSITRAPGQ